MLAMCRRARPGRLCDQRWPPPWPGKAITITQRIGWHSSQCKPVSGPERDSCPFLTVGAKAPTMLVLSASP